MKTKHRGQMSESFLTAVFLSLSGGLQDAYTYLFRGKVFANAQPGNIVLLSAYIMDGQDPRQVMLGYDTNCCQHLNGAGETAMMYGLANPDAGFFVIEDKETGKILAQAETWECAPEYRSVRTEEINLQTVFNDDINLANQLYRGVENYIEEGYCSD